MNYPIHVEGFEGQRIEVQTAGMFSGQKLLVNGAPAPKGAKRGEMSLRRNDGTELVAKWKPQMLGFDVPQLQIGDDTIQIVEPLKWYEIVWSGLPLVLIIAGGLLGAISGLIALTINLKLFRSTLSTALKYAVTLIVTIGAFFLYTVLAVGINILLG